MRRNKKLMKVLTGTLATAMLVGGTIPAYAATGTSGTTSTGAVTTGDAISGINSVSVYAEIGSQYTVTIPKTITLDGSTKTGAYTVSITGDIAGNEVVNVVPDTSFTMSQAGKADVTASIEQDKTSWKVAEFGTNGAGTINVSTLSAGAWNGTFNFNVGLSKLKAGAYDASGNLLYEFPEGTTEIEKETLYEYIHNIANVILPDTINHIGYSSLVDYSDGTATITYKNKTYTYAQREELKTVLENNGVTVDNGALSYD